MSVALDTYRLLKREIPEILGEMDQLDQAILAKAFRGELVPQEPNDEPAAVLLERIRAHRTQQAEATKGQKKTAKTQRPNALTKSASGAASSHQARPRLPAATDQPKTPEQLQLEY